MPTVRVNGITMYYEQHGAGEPVLLINGLGADMTLLAPLMAWFARSCKRFLIDLAIIWMMACATMNGAAYSSEHGSPAAGGIRDNCRASVGIRLHI